MFPQIPCSSFSDDVFCTFLSMRRTMRPSKRSKRRRRFHSWQFSTIRMRRGLRSVMGGLATRLALVARSATAWGFAASRVAAKSDG